MSTEASDFWKRNKTLVQVLVATVVHPASRLAAAYSTTQLREACARVVGKLRVSAEQMGVPKKARRVRVETPTAEEREAAPSVASAPSSVASSSTAPSSASPSPSSSSPSTETPASPAADDGHRMLVYFQQPPLVRCRLSVALEEGWLCGPAPHNEMVSRRKILSRSRDDLNLDSTFAVQEEEEDVWYQRDKLYKDHIQEVLDKWTQIDDEIWAKVIVLERNRRVAKAYARAPVLTINGSDDGFDGFRIGLCGFDNPMRDAKTEEVKRHIGQGVKVKMDDQGNILVKRVSKSNVYVKSTAGSPDEETSIGNDVLKLPGCALEMEKPVKLFDMKKFQQNVSRELRRAYPDRRRLECQCLSVVAFVKNEPELLDCPIWVLVVNVVAMDMLKSKLPPVKRPVDIRNRPRIPIPDEDPYSVAGSGGSSGGSSGGVGGGPGGVVAAARDQLVQQGRRDRPPKLPPRDTAYPQDIPKPDYDDVDEDSRLKPFPSSRSSGRDKAKDSKKYDDPYYCGLRARVPKFVTSRVPPPKEAAPPPPPSVVGRFAAFPPQAHVQAQQALYHQHHHNHHPHHGHHPPPTMWHARSFDSGMDSEALESPYNHIYGRLPIPTRAYIPPTPRAMFVGDWD